MTQSAARVDVLLDLTHFAGDLAAPLEAAETVDARLDGARLVAAAAAQQFAAFDARRRTVAQATDRAQRSRVPVCQTIIRRFFRID